MSKPRSESDLSDQLDSNLTYRLKEISDLKQAILDANPLNRDVLLKALIALSYAHWEGFVKFSAQKYFEFIALRKHSYAALNPQFYINSFLVRLGSLHQNKPNIHERANLISEILSSRENRFSYLHPTLINTGSNLKFEIFKEICLICGIDHSKFSNKENFIDVILLKRRNSIAHGDKSVVSISEMDELANETIGLMRSFKNELENRIYNREYLVI
jgi:hypothetical protein